MCTLDKERMRDFVISSDHRVSQAPEWQGSSSAVLLYLTELPLALACAGRLVGTTWPCMGKSAHRGGSGDGASATHAHMYVHIHAQFRLGWLGPEMIIKPPELLA